MNHKVAALFVALVLAPIARSQTPAAAPAFEVADLKPADPSAPMQRKGRVLPGGRLELPGISAKDLIMFSYGVQENMIVGLPPWATRERYDLVAKAPASVSPPELRLMTQTLLAERLQLTIHREDRVMPAYVLSVGKRTSKLQKGDGGRQDCHWSNVEQGLARRTCQNMTMEEFARSMPGLGGAGIDLPVVNQTGLEGKWNFEFDMGMSRGRNEGRGGGADSAGKGNEALPVASDDSGPTIFSALEGIGLKLEQRKLPLQVIVVDRVEKPTSN